MSAIAGKVGAIYVSDGTASSSFTGEACTDSGDSTTFYITDTSKRYWDESNGVTVYVASTPTTDITIQYAGGRIVTSTPVIGDVTVDGKYYTMEQQGGFINWSVDVEFATSDTTAFESNGWKGNVTTLNGWTVSAERHWFNGDFLSRDNVIALALYVNYSDDIRYDGFAYLTSNSIEDPVDDLVSESIDFVGSGTIYFNTY